MANAYPTGFQGDNPDAPAAAADRGLFDCFGKKEDKEDVPMTDAEHKPSLMEKLHRSNSSSSSSSEEEVEEGGMKIRRRKKKGLTDKIKEKLPGHKKEGAEGNYNHHPAAATNEEDKKGIFDKIKEKLPGHHKDEAVIAPHPAPAPGFVEKIKEKLPGHHKDEPELDRHPTPAPGILEKVKEKLPGHHNDEAVIAPHTAPAPAHTYAAAPAPAYYEAPAPAYSAAPAPAPAHAATGEHYGEVHGAPEQHEKKGIFEMIKEKLPGGHKDGEVKKDH